MDIKQLISPVDCYILGKRCETCLSLNFNRFDKKTIVNKWVIIIKKSLLRCGSDNSISANLSFCFQDSYSHYKMDNPWTCAIDEPSDSYFAASTC
jgi:hypothetical protein